MTWERAWRAAVPLGSIKRDFKTGQVLLGGWVDLTYPNKTTINHDKEFLPGSYEGRNIWSSVREFVLDAALNGMGLHGGLKVFSETIFTFSND